MVGWLIFQASTDAIRSSLVAWETPTGGTMTVSMEVVRRPGTQVTCDLVAVDIRRVVVGQTSVEIPAGDEWRTRVDAEIPLQGDAVALNCASARLDSQIPAPAAVLVTWSLPHRPSPGEGPVAHRTRVRVGADKAPGSRCRDLD